MSTSATTPPVVEGEADFLYPAAGKPLKTWYKITGDLTPTSIPLIILHGGPSVGSEGYNAFVDLTVTHSIPIIQYDQVGCKRSTHLRDKAEAGAEFWSENLFVAELHSLIKHLSLDGEGRQYDVLGHSWGGMFGTTFVAGRPKGLRKYIIMSSAGSIDLWVEAQNKLRRTLPKEVQDVMDRCEKNGSTESDEYQGAMLEYYSRFLCRLDPVPEEIMDGLGELGKDPTPYSVM